MKLSHEKTWAAMYVFATMGSLQTSKLWAYEPSRWSMTDHQTNAESFALLAFEQMTSCLQEVYLLITPQ
jgi:hypothetical protein